MSIIRKIVVGPDLKNGMVYSVGQTVMQESHVIHDIRKDKDWNVHVRVINQDKEVYVWKSFNGNVPVSTEYSIDF